MGSQVHHKLPCNVQHFLLGSRQSQAFSNSPSDSPLYSCEASRWLHPASGSHKHAPGTCHFTRHSSGRTNVMLQFGSSPPCAPALFRTKQVPPTTPLPHLDPSFTRGFHSRWASPHPIVFVSARNSFHSTLGMELLSHS